MDQINQWLVLLQKHMHEELFTTNIKEKSLARNKLKASTQLVDMIKPQEFIRNMILIKHATQFFQPLLLTENIYFNSSKLN